MEATNWQTHHSSLGERNKYAFKELLFCDVKFLVQDSNGNQVLVPANKYVLAISSPVFGAMFYGTLAESKADIELPDCTKEGLHELLRYVNTDQVNLTGSTCMEVLYLADKYMMPFLVEKCKDYLHDEVGPDDVLSVLPGVQKIGEEDLLKHLWTIVDNQTHLIVSSEAFLNVSQEMLSQILERETLQINELDLFRAVDRWAEERIKEKDLDSNSKTKRSILGDEVIRLIRFSSMTQREFVEVVLPRRILKKDEVIAVVQWFTNVASAPDGDENILVTSERFGSIKPPKPGGPWSYPSDLTDAVDFSTTKPVDLVGVRMFGSDGSTYKVNLKIHKGDEIISQLCSSFVTDSEMIDGLYYGFTVNLDRPVRLESGIVYTVEASIFGPPSYYGDLSLSGRAVDCDVTVTYTNSSRSNNLTSFDRGQFPSFVFQKLPTRADQRITYHF